MLLAAEVQAFNANAHRVVGHIAASQVCAETRLALAQLDPRRDIAAAGTWADEIRGREEWDRARTWHFINVDDAQTVAGALADDPNARHVLWAIDRFRAVLALGSGSAAERRQAYRFLVHFVADVHQPLHVGRRADRGGNFVRVVAAGGLRTNLHRYWDGLALAEHLRTPERHAQRLIAAATPDALRRWRNGAPLQWASESKDYRPVVYGFPLVARGQRAVLDDTYRDKAIEIINLRLTMAGVRLAGVLDEVFCRPDEPAAPARHQALRGGA